MSKRAVLAALLRRDFGAFLQKSVYTIHPGSEFMPNWHIDAAIHQLDRVTVGESQRLLINQPPRSLKSITVSVAYPAWLLGRDPATRIIVVSYSREFAVELQRQFRLIVESDWYRAVFPKTVWAKETELDFITTKGGGRFATSIGGTLTGRGADVIIVDDPLNANDAQSEPARKRVIDFFRGSLISRLNDKKRGVIIVVAQRLHDDDLPGHLLREGGWYHLNFPAFSVDDEHIPVGQAKVHHRRIGDVLHPARESGETLERLRADVGSLVFAAQYQQNPVPVEGNIVNRSWFRTYEDLPDGKPGSLIVQSWDVASMTGEQNDYSVGTTWHASRKNVYLLDIWRGRLIYPDLRRKVIALAEQFKADTIIIEEAGPGLQLLQDLQCNTPERMTRPIGMRPEGSKADRFVTQSARIEAGFVQLPKENPKLGDYLTELLAFPAGRHDDQVDSTSQFLAWWWKWRETSRVTLAAGPIYFYADGTIRGAPNWFSPNSPRR